MRAVVADERTGLIYTGGWGAYNGIEQFSRPGTGLWISDDNGLTFKEHPLIDQIVDRGGRLSINAIEIARHNDQQVILIGGEGSGPGIRTPSPDYPFLFIAKDGRLYDPDKVNLRELASIFGQDIITPQHGIKVSATTGKVFVSSWARDIAYTHLGAIIAGDRLRWTRVTRPAARDQYFGAGHIRCARDSQGREELFSGGNLYGSSPVRFLPIRATRVEA